MIDQNGIKRCPVCFSRIDVSEEAQATLSQVGIYIWTHEPINTPHGCPFYIQDENEKSNAEGFTIIHLQHLSELQSARHEQEVEAGIPVEDQTEFSSIPSPTPDSEGNPQPVFFMIHKDHILELRESTEKILEALQVDKENYFNYDEFGNYQRDNSDGKDQTDWVDITEEFEKKDKVYTVKNIHVEDIRHPLPPTIPMQVMWNRIWPRRWIKEAICFENWGYFHSGGAECFMLAMGPFYYGFTIDYYYMAGCCDRLKYGDVGTWHGGCDKAGVVGFAGLPVDRGCGCSGEAWPGGPLLCAGKFIRYNGSINKHNFYSTVYPGNRVKMEVQLKAFIQDEEGNPLDFHPDEIILHEYSCPPVEITETVSRVSPAFLESAQKGGHLNEVVLVPRPEGWRPPDPRFPWLDNEYRSYDIYADTYSDDKWLSLVERDNTTDVPSDPDVKHWTIVKQWNIGYHWAMWYPCFYVRCWDFPQDDGFFYGSHHVKTIGLTHDRVETANYSYFIPAMWRLEEAEDRQGSIVARLQQNKYVPCRTTTFTNQGGSETSAVPTLITFRQGPWNIGGCVTCNYDSHLDMDICYCTASPRTNYGHRALLANIAPTEGAGSDLWPPIDGVMYIAEDLYEDEEYQASDEGEVQLKHEDVVGKSVTVVAENEVWSQVKDETAMEAYGPESLVYYVSGNKLHFGLGGQEQTGTETGIVDEGAHGKFPEGIITVTYCCKPLTVSHWYANGDAILGDSVDNDLAVYAGLNYYPIPSTPKGDNFPFSDDMRLYWMQPDYTYPEGLGEMCIDEARIPLAPKGSDDEAHQQGNDCETWMGPGNFFDFPMIWHWGMVKMDNHDIGGDGCPIPLGRGGSWVAPDFWEANPAT